jgi:hypothetical protein
MFQIMECLSWHRQTKYCAKPLTKELATHELHAHKPETKEENERPLPIDVLMTALASFL